MPSIPGLSRPAMEILIDLVEIKLSQIEVWDRDDAREQRALQRAKGELATLLAHLPRQKARLSQTVERSGGRAIRTA